MQPAKPEIDGTDEYLVDFATNQPQYKLLPAIKFPSGEVITRWTPSEHERARIAKGEDIYLCVMTFHQPLQPLLVTAGAPEVELPVKPDVIEMHAEKSKLTQNITIVTCVNCDGEIIGRISPIVLPGNEPTTATINREIGACVLEHAGHHKLRLPRMFETLTRDETGVLVMKIAEKEQIEKYLGRPIK